MIERGRHRYRAQVIEDAEMVKAGKLDRRWSRQTLRSADGVKGVT
jgi:hypothetical protein